jgi:hypothetical protein
MRRARSRTISSSRYLRAVGSVTLRDLGYLSHLIVDQLACALPIKVRADRGQSVACVSSVVSGDCLLLAHLLARAALRGHRGPRLLGLRANGRLALHRFSRPPHSATMRALQMPEGTELAGLWLGPPSAPEDAAK